MVDSAYETEKGLENLKNAFLIYLVSYLFILIPIVNFAAGIMGIVGLVFLIMGWRALGRSSLSEAQNYQSTGRWFIFAIIIVFVVSIVGIVITVFSVASFIASNPITQSSGTFNFPPAVFTTFVSGLLGTVAIAYAVWLSAWFKMNSSASKLAKELSQPMIAKSGFLFLISSIIGYVTLVALVYSILLGFFSVSNLSSAAGGFGSYYAMLTGKFVFFGILGFAGTIVAIVASYYGYDGVKRVLSSRVVYGFKTPTPPPSNVESCPTCGKILPMQNAVFCPNCGSGLKAR